jgi:hypothetical protein
MNIVPSDIVKVIYEAQIKEQLQAIPKNPPLTRKQKIKLRLRNYWFNIKHIKDLRITHSWNIRDF